MAWLLFYVTRLFRTQWKAGSGRNINSANFSRLMIQRQRLLLFEICSGNQSPGDFKIPGIGEVEIGINQLQASGVMFCVCNMALTVLSAVAAENMKMDAKEVYKDWVSGLLPDIQIVPSGVWAVGRAQEHGCAYCYAGK